MLSERIRSGLQDLRDRHLLRTPRVVEKFRGPYAVVDGREVVNFASNDYLGLGQEPRLAEAARAAALEGWAPASSRLLSGTMRVHLELERAAAEFLGVEDALFFPSGYMANLGLISAIAGPDVTILSDELNHASLIDACRLSRAKIVKIPHVDLNAYEGELKKPGEKIVLTDTVFSMDGDLAPLSELATLCERHGADLVVDDAHAFGVFDDGRGLAQRVAIRTVTLSKAAGCAGGIVAGSREAIEFLRTRARTFMFTTAPPAPLCAAAIEAIRLLREPARREKLWANVRRMGAASPIVPVPMGDNARAVEAANRLWEAGYWVPAVRPPAVPSARLRISVTALHEPAHLDGLKRLLA